ncbi:DUF2510 domain-containing protein [Streptomyces sp. NPDC005374]|uniref:DUF2510 domain-containing protein n=1 Tax=Streptomyces sp. NPDC005374 TaxID=3364713 RepID=UPI0036B3784A
MSSRLPPGWYPDPDAPHLERRWDGTAWTDQRRAPEPPGPPRPADGASGRAKAVALVVSGAVLVTAIVTGTYALARGDGDDVVADTAPTVAPPSPSTTSSPPSRLVDELDGISLPLPDGWTPSKYVTRDNVVMTTHGGRVLARTLPPKPGTSPAALAAKDIPQAADASYGGGESGPGPHGGIESHRVLRSERVSVAGGAGYLVRWRVRTAEGPGGYVQSLALTPGADRGSPSAAVVVVRFAFDAGPGGPPLADMDRITEGIRPVDQEK